MQLVRWLANVTGVAEAIRREERKEVGRQLLNGIHVFDQPHKRRYAFHGATDVLRDVALRLSGDTLTEDLTPTYRYLVEQEQSRWRAWSQSQQEAKRIKRERENDTVGG